MEHTLEQVANLVREKRKASDCLVIMGDMNGRLQRGDMDSRRVGPFTPHARGDEGGRLMGQLMEEFDLWAPLIIPRSDIARVKHLQGWKTFRTPMEVYTDPLCPPTPGCYRLYGWMLPPGVPPAPSLV